jgi:hypothetical protein
VIWRSRDRNGLKSLRNTAQPTATKSDTVNAERTEAWKVEQDRVIGTREAFTIPLLWLFRAEGLLLSQFQAAFFTCGSPMRCGSSLYLSTSFARK